MDTNTLYNKLKSYAGSSQFINSLQRQLNVKGQLTARQIQCGIQFFSPKQEPKIAINTVSQGQEITIRKWLAQSLANQLKMPFFFRNLVVEEVLNETSKAINVKVRFNNNIAACCHFCGRGLDNEVSKATGVGPVCAKKYLKVSRPTVDSAKEIIDKINAEAQNAGVIGPLWIPKSQLVSAGQKVLFGVE